MLNHRLLSLLLISTALLPFTGCKTSRIQKSNTSVADTAMASIVTYTNHIKPLIDPACGTKCHKAAFHAGDVDLSNYEGVKDAAVNGQMIPALEHAEGVKPMPKNGEPFTAEEIDLI